LDAIQGYRLGESRLDKDRFNNGRLVKGRVVTNRLVKKTDKEIHAVVEVLYKRVVARYNDFKKILSQIKQGALTSAEIRNWKLIYTEEHDALIKPLLDLRLKRPPYSYGTGIGDKQVAEWIDDAEKKFNEISKISSA
jgi:hypothetical protein